MVEALKNGFDRAKAVFSFKATIILLTGMTTTVFYWFEMEKAAIAFFGIFSSWTGQWLFNDKKKEGD